MPNCAGIKCMHSGFYLILFIILFENNFILEYVYVQLFVGCLIVMHSVLSVSD